MARIDTTIWCDGCGVEIVWGPLVVGRQTFCCQDCLDGRPCMCGERLDQEVDRHTRPAGHSPEVWYG